MDNFEKACVLSNEEWFEQIPDELPEYEFSEEYKRKINTLVKGLEPSKRKGLPRKIVKYLIIAAILSALLIASTAFAVPGQKAFVVTKFDVGSEYTVENPKKNFKISDLKVSYVPDGFVITDTHYDADKHIMALEYANESLNQRYVIEKIPETSAVCFDTEEYPSKEVEVNGITYVVYRATPEYYGIIWNSGGYIYIIDGNTSEDDLINLSKAVS